MSNLYQFGKYGTILRQNGMTIKDGHGNYICGKPMIVWWWPLNWIVFLLYIPAFILTRIK